MFRDVTYFTTSTDYTVLSGYYQDATGNSHFTHQEAIEIGERIPGWQLCTDEFHKALAEAVWDSEKGRWRKKVCGTKLNGYEYMTKVLKYKLGGFRYYGTGALADVGNEGSVWSASVSGTSGVYLRFVTNAAQPSYANYRALGFQVRCLQE